MKHDCHLICLPMHESPKQGQDYSAQCGKLIVGAMWIWTSGEIPDLAEMVKQLGMTCRECVVKFGQTTDRVRVYGAVSQETFERLRRKRDIE